MTEAEFVPKPQVKQWDDEVREFVEAVEVRLDKRIDELKEEHGGRISKVEKAHLNFEGLIQGRLDEAGQNTARQVDKVLAAVSNLDAKVSPVFDELFSDPEKRAESIDFIKSGKNVRKKRGQYWDIAIKTLIVMGVTGAVTFVLGACWTAFKSKVQEPTTVSAPSVTVPSQTTTVIAPTAK